MLSMHPELAHEACMSVECAGVLTICGYLSLSLRLA